MKMYVLVGEGGHLCDGYSLLRATENKNIADAWKEYCEKHEKKRPQYPRSRSGIPSSKKLAAWNAAMDKWAEKLIHPDCRYRSRFFVTEVTKLRIEDLIKRKRA